MSLRMGGSLLLRQGVRSPSVHETLSAFHSLPFKRCLAASGFFLGLCHSPLCTQVNDWQEDWVAFYARQRLQPQMDMVEQGSGDREARELWSALQVSAARARLGSSRGRCGHRESRPGQEVGWAGQRGGCRCPCTPSEPCVSLRICATLCWGGWATQESVCVPPTCAGYVAEKGFPSCS